MSSKANRDLEATDPEAFKRMLKEFKEIMMKKCTPLPDDPDYFTSDLILTDFLRARKYNLNAAVDMLTAAVAWRRDYQPLKVDCNYCHDQPGFHCIRQVGHDKIGRPILYACFAQASAPKNHSSDTIMHCVHFLENVRRSFKGSATQIVFIIDCSGMTLPCCNPNLGKKVMNVFADYYPERLGKAIIVNHKTIFSQIWRALKKFIDPVTASKVVFLKKKKGPSKSKSKNLSDGLREICDEATAQWIETEIELNKNMTEEQMRFWEKPVGFAHDPRGTEAYVREYIDCDQAPNGFMPHPNITDLKAGKLKRGYPVQVKKGSGDTKLDKRQMEEYGIAEEDLKVDEESDS